MEGNREINQLIFTVYTRNRITSHGLPRSRVNLA